MQFFPNAANGATLRMPREGFLLNVIRAEGEGSLSVSGGGSRCRPTSQTSRLSVFGSLSDVQNFHSYVLSVARVYILIKFLTMKHRWQKSNIKKKKNSKKSSLSGVNLAGLLSQHMSNRKTVCLKAVCTSLLWKRQDSDVMLTDGGFCHSKRWILIISLFQPINFTVIIIIKISFSHRCWCRSEVWLLLRWRDFSFLMQPAKDPLFSWCFTDNKYEHM